MHPVGDAPPVVHLLIGPQARATRCDPPLGAHPQHLGKHQASSAQRARAQMNQVVVGGTTLDRRVLGHGRHHDPVFQGQTTHPIGREHGWRGDLGRGGLALRCRPLGKPLFIARQPIGVSQAQVFVPDALAAGEHGIHELFGLELIAIALATDLKPFHGVPSRVLYAQGVDTANGLVLRQHLGQVFGGIANGLELTHQLDGVFEGQLGARANGKVGGVHRVAHQHDVCALLVFQPPLLAHHALKVQPRRTPQMTRIGHQRMALQVVGKELLAKRNRLRLIGLVQAVRQPHVLGALHDEGRGVFIEFVDVGLKPAVLGFLKVEGEGVVQAMRAQPDVAVGAHHDVGLEVRLVLVANAGVDAVAGNDEVGIGKIGVRHHLLFKHQLHAQLLAAGLQDVEEFFAPNAHKAVTPRSDAAALEQQLDVVPVVEGLLNFVGRGPIPQAHVVHGGVGEHHPPAKGVVGPVALHHPHPMRRVELFHQNREIQAGWPTADANNVHAPPLLKIEYFKLQTI